MLGLSPIFRYTRVSSVQDPLLSLYLACLIGIPIVDYDTPQYIEEYHYPLLISAHVIRRCIHIQIICMY